MTIEDLIRRNRELATNHEPYPMVSDLIEKGLTPPRILILTCCDPRCTPERFLGLGRLEAIVLRNVCGHIAPQIPELVGVDQNVNFEEVMIIHHTDCGALYFNEAKFRETLVTRAPAQAEEIESLNFGTITDVKQSVLDDIAILRASPLVRQEVKDSTRGFVFDIGTGLLEEIFP